MAKKRPTLDAFLNTQNTTAAVEDNVPPVAPNQTSAKKSVKTSAVKAEKSGSVKQATASAAPANKKTEVIRHMLYLPLPVYDQLQGLIYEEQRGQTKRRKTHDYLLDAIDLLFKKKGLKSIAELTRGDDGEND